MIYFKDLTIKHKTYDLRFMSGFGNKRAKGHEYSAYTPKGNYIASAKSKSELRQSVKEVFEMVKNTSYDKLDGVYFSLKEEYTGELAPVSSSKGVGSTSTSNT